MVKDQIEVASDPIVDLFDAFVASHSFEVDVGIGDDGREGGGDLDSIRESNGHCVTADALDKAGGLLLWLGRIQKGRGSGVEVGGGYHLE